MADREHQATALKPNYGYAAEDLVPGSVELKVIIGELTPGALDGALAAGSSTAQVTTTNARGVEERSAATTANHIIATYAGSEFFKYAPQVCKGEQVEITQVGDTGKYYWRSLGRDPELRKPDTVRLESAAAPGLKAAKDDGNTYFIELSGRTKRLEVRTSKANGEPFAYAFRFDTAAGVVALADDVGNRFVLDSAANQLQLNNKDGSLLNLIGKNAILGAIEDLILKGGRQIVMDSPTITGVHSSGDGVMAFQTKGVAFRTETFVVDAGTVGLNGAVKVNGPLVSGPHRAEGFGTGAVGTAYAAPSTDVATGGGTVPANPADTAAIDPSVRSAAAWEQVSEALLLIKACFAEVHAQIGAPNQNQDTLLPELAEAARMPKNRGA